jgi:hypothetical protein
MIIIDLSEGGKVEGKCQEGQGKKVTGDVALRTATRGTASA